MSNINSSLTRASKRSHCSNTPSLHRTVPLFESQCPLPRPLNRKLIITLHPLSLSKPQVQCLQLQIRIPGYLRPRPISRMVSQCLEQGWEGMGGQLQPIMSLQPSLGTTWIWTLVKQSRALILRARLATVRSVKYVLSFCNSMYVYFQNITSAKKSKWHRPKFRLQRISPVRKDLNNPNPE